jgi:ribose transport system ATP-binding protein
MQHRVVLRLTDVTKAFAGVVALREASLEVLEGEVHALLGENGAGKSTLMSIAAGVMAADEGSVEIGGTSLVQALPDAAQALGISVVYQHTSVLNDLTVAENLLYGVPAERRGAGADSVYQWVATQLDQVGARFDQRVRVAGLSAAERQLVEIAKALASEPKVLVLDEPTEALTGTETEQLFANIERITAAGTAVVYISHRLPEVRRVADRLTILRDGQVRGTFSVEGVSEDEILALIIGRPVRHVFPDKSAVSKGPLPQLRARGITNHILQEVDFEAWPGQIVGLAGVEGNGQREFIRALAGLTPAVGEMSVMGRATPLGDPTGAQGLGIVYLPGDRHREGLFLSLSVRENMTARVLSSLSKLGFVSSHRETNLVTTQIEALAIRTASTELSIASLSGGNQQKVLFARSLACNPKVLLADEPTRGVDAGARMELYRVLRNAANGGASVVVLSSDAIELQGLCDRVSVFSRGGIVRTLTGDEITEKNITGAAINADTQRVHSAGILDQRRTALHRFVSGDYAPTMILLALILMLGVYTSFVSPHFFTERTIKNILFLASTLTLVGMGQLIVLLTGGLDLSVGPLTGLTVVILSFFLGEGQTTANMLLGFTAAAAAAVAVGAMNGAMIRRIGLTPVVATLTSYIALKGIGLLLRSPPGGYIRSDVVDVITAHVGPIPFSFVVVATTVIASEYALRKTRFGMELRAIGSSEEAAYRLGAKVDHSVIVAYVLCSFFTALGGILLSAQVGIGDPAVGANYSLQSVSAVVLGGGSIFGGRGSFLGVLASAVLIQEIMAATGFLGLGTSWQYWLPSILILIAAGAYSRARASATN